MPTGSKISLMVAALLTAAGLISGCGSDPTPTVQVRNETPQVCLDALDAADAVISDAGDIMGIAGDALIAFGNGDGGPMLSADDRVEVVKAHMIPQLDAYKAASAACRG